eukprot:77218-Chlamydomonas_euryale.AAC.1
MGFDVYGLIVEADDIPDPDGGYGCASRACRGEASRDEASGSDTCSSAAELLVRVKSVFDTHKSRLQNDAALKFSAVTGNPWEALAEFLPRFSQ